MRSYHLIMAALVASFVTGSALAQSETPIERSSAPMGIQIRGNSDLRASQEDATSVAVGRENLSRNSAGAIKDAVQIQGDVNIKASQKNVSTHTFGKNNSATNEAGVIGGK